MKMLAGLWCVKNGAVLSACITNQLYRTQTLDFTDTISIRYRYYAALLSYSVSLIPFCYDSVLVGYRIDCGSIFLRNNMTAHYQ